MRQEGATRTSRDYVALPQPRMAITELSVAVNFARRGDWVGEAPHTYFYVNGRLKAPKILQSDRIYPAFAGQGRLGESERAVLRLQHALVTLAILQDHLRCRFARRGQRGNPDIGLQVEVKA